MQLQFHVSCPKGLTASASDYACMHLINNSTMHGIDVGQRSAGE